MSGWLSSISTFVGSLGETKHPRYDGPASNAYDLFQKRIQNLYDWIVTVPAYQSMPETNKVMFSHLIKSENRVSWVQQYTVKAFRDNNGEVDRIVASIASAFGLDIRLFSAAENTKLKRFCEYFIEASIQTQERIAQSKARAAYEQTLAARQARGRKFAFLKPYSLEVSEKWVIWRLPSRRLDQAGW